MHLALRRARVDVFQPMRRRIDHAAVGQRFEERVAGEADDLALLAGRIDGEELDDAVGDLFGAGGGCGGDGGGGGAEGEVERGRFGEFREAINGGDRHC